MFLCARCRTQVVLCSRCDRGNRYCGPACWRLARNAARRETARRYQRSRRGRLTHAARSRRWRQRHAVICRVDGDTDTGVGVGVGAHNVTHQGSRTGVGAAPLAVCTNANATATTTANATASASTTASAMPSPPSAPPPAQEPLVTQPWHCRRCGREQPAWLRQGFLRHRRTSALPMALFGRRHDHSP
jgi:hypothetical protein